MTDLALDLFTRSTNLRRRRRQPAPVLLALNQGQLGQSRNTYVFFQIGISHISGQSLVVHRRRSCGRDRVEMEISRQ